MGGTRVGSNTKVYENQMEAFTKEKERSKETTLGHVSQSNSIWILRVL